MLYASYWQCLFKIIRYLGYALWQSSKAGLDKIRTSIFITCECLWASGQWHCQCVVLAVSLSPQLYTAHLWQSLCHPLSERKGTSKTGGWEKKKQHNFHLWRRKKNRITKSIHMPGWSKSDFLLLSSISLSLSATPRWWGGVFDHILPLFCSL